MTPSAPDVSGADWSTLLGLATALSSAGVERSRAKTTAAAAMMAATARIDVRMNE
jgi:hypothetical protein